MRMKIDTPRAVGLGLGLATFGFFLWSVVPLWRTPPVPAPTRVLARDGTLLYEVSADDTETAAPVPLAQLPPALVHAVVSAEDKRFWRHRGIDWLALGRALADDVRAGHVVSGGSTIEEQLVKNTFFADQPRNFVEKIRELVAARWWSLTHAKEETLERYLNTVYLGDNVFGMPAAARTYFHKDVRDLALPEAAMLAGVIGAPARYEPVSHRSAAYARQQFALARMRADGSVTAAQEKEATDVTLSVFAPRHQIRAPHFVFRALDLLEQTIPDIRTGGYTVITTLDLGLQSSAEGSVGRQLGRLGDKHVTDAAAIALDPRSGEVLAYVGSADYWDDKIGGKINMAAAPRQPGSALKPFMYLDAIARKQLTPATVLPDLPVRFDVVGEDGQGGGSYVPRNYNVRYNGPVSVRDALGSSLNIPAVEALQTLGLDRFFGTLSRFGLTFPRPPAYYGLAVVLGGGEVTLEDATHAYATLAAGNSSAPLTFVKTVADRRGTTVFAAPTAQPQSIFDARDAQAYRQANALITDILSDRTARTKSFGETSQMDLGFPAAAKTGTTKDFRDNWAFGYAPDFAVGVWVGNADNSQMHEVSGVSGAVPIWHDVMMARFRYKDPAPFPAVPGIVTREVCVTSGLLANGICPKTRVEKFIDGTQPTEPDTWYQAKGNQIVLNPPAAYAAWAKSAGIATAGATGPSVIVSPLDGDAIEIDPNISMTSQLIPFTASGGCAGGCHWSLNGEPLPQTSSTVLWRPRPGSYTLSLNGSASAVHFSVQ